MVKKVFFTLLVLVVSLFSCKQKEEPFVIPAIKLSAAPDQTGFIRDITPGDTVTNSRRIREKAEEGLKLDAIVNGFDKLQIRVWNEQEGGYKGKLFRLENKAEKWTAALYQYWYIFDKDFQVLDSIGGREIKLQEPRSGWNSLPTNSYALTS